MDERLLSPTAFAKAAGLQPDTVRRLCRQGDLPAVKFGKRAWRIPASALKATPKPAEAA